MPSAKVLEGKQKIVADLAERMKSSAAGVLVNYQGITVADDTALRAELRKAGVEYTVIKNTLISKACDIVGFEGLKDVLSGMTAIATSNDDAVAAARIINEFAKKNENYTIKAGFVEGELLDVAGVEELAAIPPREVLIGRLMGSMRSSLYGFVYALQAIIDKSGEAAPADAGESAEEAPAQADAPAKA